jgi:hypothetical protein
MGRKPQVQARIPNDLKERIDEYCDEHDISTTESVRRALEKEYRLPDQPDTTDGTDADSGDRLADRFDDVQAVSERARRGVAEAILYLFMAFLGAFAGSGGAL